MAKKQNWIERNIAKILFFLSGMTFSVSLISFFSKPELLNNPVGGFIFLGLSILGTILAISQQYLKY